MMNTYEAFDACYGTVTGRSNSGAYLQMDNGQEAFSYKFANLREGTKVLCTVLRPATERKRTLVSIDSTLVSVA